MNCQYEYQKLALNDFLKTYYLGIVNSELFELTPIWLEATAHYMLSAHEQVIVHCLFEVNCNEAEQEELLIAWPLVHEKIGKQRLIRSLTSFYSAVSEPIVAINGSSTIDVEDDALSSTKFDGRSSRHSGCNLSRNPQDLYFTTLLNHIKEHNTWQQMFLGPLEQEGLAARQVLAKNTLVKTYACADNWYCDNIQNYQNYLSQRSSQLKNTVKRKEKKLAKAHDYHINIITSAEEFEHHFLDYQRIYQLSWKGEETSFEFIKQVALQAAAENKLRMGMLFVDNQGVAVQLWFLQKNTASIFKLAYDPAFKAFSVGSILSMALSEHVVELDKVDCIEFGMGSEPYKQDWMNKKRQRLTLQVFNERNILGILAAVKYILLSKLKNLFN